MFANMTVSSTRSAAVEEFLRNLGKARFQSSLAHLLRRKSRPDRFDIFIPSLQPARCYLGIQEIPLAKITGSVTRLDDFDRRFRPLKKHLRDRWVNIYLLAQSQGWPPIQVYQVGDRYFVQDGHHRVSVAQALGLPGIEAEVWEFRPIQTESEPSACAAFEPQALWPQPTEVSALCCVLGQPAQSQ